jgi:hypothetical protein
MKELFFDQVELLVATYRTGDEAQRARLDQAMDHVTALLYELLHQAEFAAPDYEDVLVAVPPPAAGRILH